MRLQAENWKPSNKTALLIIVSAILLFLSADLLSLSMFTAKVRRDMKFFEADKK